MTAAGTETIVDGSPPPGPASTARGQRLGRYAVLEPLGAGGAGTVVAAYDSVLDRKVALKSLYTNEAAPGLQRVNLRSEAQALAKLSHKNVVRVFDVDEQNGVLFIAMEYVDGDDLRKWAAASPRRRAEVVSVYVAAGKGLQAAHDAGIIHRDFKPENVLVGRDGRVRVTDFGLATTVGPEASTHSRLTGGTLPYMPPEQHRGETMDARADQFSFCVALYETLYGIRPFAGRTSEELCTAIETRELQQPSRDVPVPRWMQRAILRGLSADRVARFRSMRHLLRALTRRRRSAAWIATAALGAGVGAGLVAGSGTPPCSGFRAEMAATYGETTRKAIAEAFRAHADPYVETSLRTTLSTLDSYAEDWVAASKNVCFASQRGEQAPDQLDLRMRCLRQGHDNLDRVVTRLRTADARVVRQATSLARLPAPSDCEQRESAMAAEYALPEDPERAREARLLLDVIDEARLHQRLSEFDRARSILEEIGDRVRSLDVPLVSTRYALLRSASAQRAGDVDAAQRHADEAFVAALENNIDGQAGRAASRACFLAAELTEDLKLAEDRCGAALALAKASRSSTVLAIALADFATLRLRQGRYDEAAAYGAERIELLRERGPSHASTLADALLAQSTILFAGSEDPLGDQLLAESEALMLDTLGENHPDLFYVKYARANRASDTGDDDSALRLALDAVDIAREMEPSGSRHEGLALVLLASAQRAVGQQWEALQSLRAADTMLVNVLGADYTERPAVLLNTASLLGASGEYERAYRRMQDVFEQAKTSSRFPTYAATANALAAQLALRIGKLEEAGEYAQAALDAAIALHGDGNVKTATPRSLLGQVARARGEVDTARSHLERAVGLGSDDPINRSEAKLELAEVLVATQDATGEDGSRAVALAREAARDLEGHFEGEKLLERALAFLDDHARGFEPG